MYAKISSLSRISVRIAFLDFWILVRLLYVLSIWLERTDLYLYSCGCQSLVCMLNMYYMCVYCEECPKDPSPPTPFSPDHARCWHPYHPILGLNVSAKNLLVSHCKSHVLKLPMHINVALFL